MMLFRRKPKSTDVLIDFEDDNPQHLCRKMYDPQSILSVGDPQHRKPGWVRYTTRTGSDPKTNPENGRWSDFAIDVEWKDIVRMVEVMATRTDCPPAKAILPLLRNPEKARQAIDILAELTRDG